MSLETLRVYCETTFQAAINTYSPKPKVRFDNQPLLQPPEMWIDFLVIPGKSMLASLGSKKIDRHIGMVQAAIMVPERQGMSAANQLAQFCGAVFRDRKVGLSDGDTVVFKVPEYRVGASTAGRGIRPETQLNYYPIIMRIPFWRDTAPY